MYVVGIGRQVNPSLLYKLPGQGKETNVHLLASGAQLADSKMIGTISDSVEKAAKGIK